jgi:methyl-accepting chemotaxis protein
MSASPKPSKRGSVFLLAAGIVVVCVCLVGLTLTVLTYTTMTADLRDTTRERALETTYLIARQAGGALQFDRPEPLEDLFSSSLSAARDKALGAVGYILSSAQETAATGAVSTDLVDLARAAAESGEAAFSPDAYAVAIPVLFGQNDAVVGAVAMEWTPEVALQAATMRMAGHVAISVGVMLVTTLLAMAAFYRTLSRPLLRLAGAMDAIGRGTPVAAIPAIGRSDEIGRIAETLEEFRDRLAVGETSRREAAFRGAAFDAASSALLVIDDDLRVLYANAAYLRLLDRLSDTLKAAFPDFDPAIVVGRKITDWHPQDTRFERLLRDTGAMPLRADMKIGDVRLSLGLASVHDDTREVSGVVAEFADVTAQTMHTSILNAIEGMQAVAEFTPGGCLSRANPRFVSALGAAVEADLVGVDVSSILSLPDSDLNEPLLGRLERGESFEGRIAGHWRGAEASFDGSLFRVDDARGQTMRFVLIARDTTKSDREMAEAAAARDVLQEQQTAVVAALSVALGRLSEGDLTTRLDQKFAPDYEGLRQNFNGAVENLCHLVGSVAELATTMRKEAVEIASSAEGLSQRTEKTAATLEETAAALDELTSSVRSASDGADRANGVVVDARSHAIRSGDVVREAVEAMSEIEASAERITRIIDVIEDIAFQTNLLALNAGVEAARAGEAGRGFAVVASEVRALAQRSSEAAREINELISSSGVQVERGVDLVRRAGEALSKIVESVSEISSLVGGIAASSKEQAASVFEINTAVNLLDQSTQQNAASFEETTAASHALTEVAEELNQALGRFETGVRDVSTVPAISGRSSRRNVDRAEIQRPASSIHQYVGNKSDTSVRTGSQALALPEPVVLETGWEEF